ncbi:MAG: hypothetical protein KDD76_04595, partial [Rickettsiales bacterium]|nr:hypothetical protein [Rickettsiales bacterium]
MMGSKIGRWVLRGVLAVVTLAVLVVSCLVLFWQELPYQAFLSRYMLHMLSERGVQASLQLEYLGKDRAILSGIRIGEEAPLRVGQMTLQYTLPELMKRKLRRVALQEVDVTLRETDNGWQMSGLEPLMAQAPSESSESAFSVFDAAPLMAALPEQVLLQNGKVHVKGTGWSTTVPLEITISGKEKVAVTATSTRPSFRRKPYTANAAALQVEAQLADGIWQGTAALPGIAVEGAPVQLPLMTAQ